MKFDRSPNCFISFSKLGKDTLGDCSERRILPAKSATLKSLFATVIPLMSDFVLSLFKRGSSDRAKIRGDRGNPWRVLLLMVKAFRQVTIHFHPR